MAISYGVPGIFRASMASLCGVFVNQQTGAVSRSQPDRNQVGGQHGPPFGTVGSRGGGASASVSQSGSSKAGSKFGSRFGTTRSKFGGVSAFASQPDSVQVGRKDSQILAVGNQRNSVTALRSLWQTGS